MPGAIRSKQGKGKCPAIITVDIAMFAAIASPLSERPGRSDVAMTGEITLRGLVPPIDGLKEQTITVQCAGVKTVIIPN